MRKRLFLFLLISCASLQAADDGYPLLFNSDDGVQTEHDSLLTHTKSAPSAKWPLKKKVILALLAGTTAGITATTFWSSWPDNRSAISVTFDPRVLNCHEKEFFFITGKCDFTDETHTCGIEQCQSEASVNTEWYIDLCTKAAGVCFGIISTTLYGMHG